MIEDLRKLAQESDISCVNCKYFLAGYYRGPDHHCNCSHFDICEPGIHFCYDFEPKPNFQAKNPDEK